MENFLFLLYDAERLGPAEIANAALRFVADQPLRKYKNGVVHHYPLGSWGLSFSPADPNTGIGLMERFSLEQEDWFIGPDGGDLAMGLARQLGPYGIRFAALALQDGRGKCNLFQSIGKPEYAEFTEGDHERVDQVLSLLAHSPTTLAQVLNWCQSTRDANPFRRPRTEADLADPYRLFLLTHGHALSPLGVRRRETAAELTTEEWAALRDAARAARRQQHAAITGVRHA